MDSAEKIKNNLISRIKNSEDLDFLKALEIIMNASESKGFQLSEEQEKAIEEARNQIKAGKFRENEQVISEMKGWLQKK